MIIPYTFPDGRISTHAQFKFVAWASDPDMYDVYLQYRVRSWWGGRRYVSVMRRERMAHKDLVHWPSIRDGMLACRQAKLDERHLRRMASYYAEWSYQELLAHRSWLIDELEHCHTQKLDRALLRKLKGIDAQIQLRRKVLAQWKTE